MTQQLDWQAFEDMAETLENDGRYDFYDTTPDDEPYIDALIAQFRGYGGTLTIRTSSDVTTLTWEN
jgi:hypothetical protein